MSRSTISLRRIGDGRPSTCPRARWWPFVALCGQMGAERAALGRRRWLCADRRVPRGLLLAGVRGLVRKNESRNAAFGRHSWPCAENRRRQVACRKLQAASRKTRAASGKTRVPQAARRVPQAARRVPKGAFAFVALCGKTRAVRAFRPAFAALCGKRATGALPATVRAPPAISMGDLQRCAVDGELLGGERVRGRRVHDRAVGDRELAAVTATVDGGRDVGVRSAAAGVQPGVGWRPDLDDSDPGLLAGCPEEVHPRLRGWVDELIKKEAIGAQLFESDVTAIRAFGSERLCRLQQSGARFVGPQSQDRDGATACGTGRAPTG